MRKIVGNFLSYHVGCKPHTHKQTVSTYLGVRSGQEELPEVAHVEECCALPTRV